MRNSSKETEGRDGLGIGMLLVLQISALAQHTALATTRTLFFSQNKLFMTELALSFFL